MDGDDLVAGLLNDRLQLLVSRIRHIEGGAAVSPTGLYFGNPNAGQRLRNRFLAMEAGHTFDLHLLGRQFVTLLAAPSVGTTNSARSRRRAETALSRRAPAQMPASPAATWCPRARRPSSRPPSQRRRRAPCGRSSRSRRNRRGHQGSPSRPPRLPVSEIGRAHV